MSRNTKIVIFAIVFYSIGVFVVFPLVVRGGYVEALNLDVSGKVVYIKWHTSNHNMPLFKIKDKKGSVISLNDGGLKLKQGQIKNGDFIVKKNGSQICSINGENVLCVPNYVSFYTMLGNIISQYFGEKHA